MIGIPEIRKFPTIALDDLAAPGLESKYLATSWLSRKFGITVGSANWGVSSMNFLRYDMVLVLAPLRVLPSPLYRPGCQLWIELREDDIP